MHKLLLRLQGLLLLRLQGLLLLRLQGLLLLRLLLLLPALQVHVEHWEGGCNWDTQHPLCKLKAEGKGGLRRLRLGRGERGEKEAGKGVWGTHPVLWVEAGVDDAVHVLQQPRASRHSHVSMLLLYLAACLQVLCSLTHNALGESPLHHGMWGSASGVVLGSC
jgi:hypothetical protein